MGRALARIDRSWPSLHRAGDGMSFSLRDLDEIDALIDRASNPVHRAVGRADPAALSPSALLVNLVAPALAKELRARLQAEQQATP
ncbi:hypothetical protein [Pararobbsia silviterrae]|uniref:hypothetical protein n=1 Tax=Pararobbsia silviterrae TaxID=1792498 RepID=UPI001407C6AB|nr:hypothetical protein [Pararobbsia silviterrae]